MSDDEIGLDERLYRGFACPQEQIHAGMLDLLVAEHARGVCAAFLQRFEDEVTRSSEGLSDMLASWMTGRASFEHGWTVGSGRLRAALREENGGESVRAAAQFGLDLLAHGLPASWSVRLTGEGRLRWGRWLLPECERMAVVSDGRRAEVSATRDGSHRRVSLRRAGGTWSAERAEALPTATIGRRRVTVLMPPVFSGAADGDVQPRLVEGVAAEEITASLERAAQLLGEISTPYLTWVSRVLRAVIPFRMDGEMYVSGSHGDRPGVVTCSFPTPPEMLCELLVHETSHQHFLILARLGDVHDGSDTKLYYSPARRLERPLFYILLAYHAVGNMLLFWRACMRSGVKLPDHCRERERELRDWARELESPLRSTTALTPLGHALWRPIAQRLRQRHAA